MAEPVARPPATTGKGVRAPTDTRYTRDTIEALRLRARRLEANRTQPGKRVSELIDGALMAGAPAGHATTFDENTGQYIPSPNLAVLTFNLIGGLFTGYSPYHWSRYATRIVGWSFLCGTLGTPPDIDLVLNSSVIATATVGAGSSHVPIAPSVLLPSYFDGLLQINVTSAGAGNRDLIVQVELGSEVAGQPGPVPFGGT